jgi:hypothetical protein
MVVQLELDPKYSKFLAELFRKGEERKYNLT